MTQFSEETRQKIAEYCTRNKIQELSLFGSRARGDARPDSDYDFLVEFIPHARIGLLELSRARIELEDLLGTKVDLGTKTSVKPHIREGVYRDAVVVYPDDGA